MRADPVAATAARARLQGATDGAGPIDATTLDALVGVGPDVAASPGRTALRSAATALSTEPADTNSASAGSATLRRAASVKVPAGPRKA